MVNEYTEKFLWVEKYRPRNLDEVVLPENYKEFFKKYIEDKNIPHLLFYGGPGSGKTTITRILINEICKSRLDLLMLNGSSSNSIDIIRNVVEDFVSTSPTEGKIKIVYYDEADYITHNAQAALRNVIEMFHSNARFIFTCNYISKINEAIQSRCQLFEFKKLPKDYIVRYATSILEKENVECDIDIINKIVDSYYPDIRRIIGILQSRVSNNKIVLDTQELNNESLVISYLKDISNGIDDKDLLKESVNKIQKIISNYDIDYKTIYQKTFEDPAVSVWMKIIINEYANKHDFCMLPAMNFMACVYQSLKVGREFSLIMR